MRLNLHVHKHKNTLTATLRSKLELSESKKKCSENNNAKKKSKGAFQHLFDCTGVFVLLQGGGTKLVLNQHNKICCPDTATTDGSSHKHEHTDSDLVPPDSRDNLDMVPATFAAYQHTLTSSHASLTMEDDDNVKLSDEFIKG